MAEHISTIHTDDIDGTEGATTVTFGFEGASYSIDLSDKNRAKLARALDPYIAAARKSGRRARKATKGSRRPAVRPAAGRTLWSSLDTDEKERMRRWGTRRKLTTKTARRIADSAVEAWLEAGKP